MRILCSWTVVLGLICLASAVAVAAGEQECSVAREGLANLEIVVVGDSVAELVALGMVGVARCTHSGLAPIKPHIVREFEVPDLSAKVVYYPAPYLEDVHRAVERILTNPAGPPSAILVHAGLHDLLYRPVLGLKHNLKDRIAASVASLTELVHTLRTQAGPGSLTFAGWDLLTPMVDANLQAHRAKAEQFCDASVDEINRAVASVLGSEAEADIVAVDANTPAREFADLGDHMEDGLHFDAVVGYEVGRAVLSAIAAARVANPEREPAEGALARRPPPPLPPAWEPSVALRAGHLVLVLYLYVALGAWLYAEGSHTVRVLSTSSTPFKDLAPTWVHGLFYNQTELAGHDDPSDVGAVNAGAVDAETAAVDADAAAAAGTGTLPPHDEEVGGNSRTTTTTTTSDKDVASASASGPTSASVDGEAGDDEPRVLDEIMSLRPPNVDQVQNFAALTQNYLLTAKGLALMRNFALLAMVILYADAADGDPQLKLWPWAPREYSRDLFVFLNLALAAASLLTIRTAKTAVRGSPQSPWEAVILNRPQTEEWKGWMQVAFVLYHYFAAKETYNMIRVFIAAYVWMTGFGNFSYFYIRKDFSMVRLAKMMFRLNFLVTIVVLGLQRQYMLYYVCALHTFAFLQVYVTMYIKSEWNEDPKVMWAKLAGLALFNFVLFDVPGVFETVMAPTYLLLGYNGSMHEWHFRTHLDHYMVVLGMLCAYVHPGATRYLKRLEASPSFVRNVVKAVVMAAVVGVVYFWATTVLIPLDKYRYNALHPYLAWIPVLSIIVLRNLFTSLRSVYLHLFAWLGRITLETYLLQLHVWLCRDAKGVTVYFDGYPLLNFAFATAIFLWLSYIAFQVTVALSDALVPRGVRLHVVVRRLVFIAIAFLVPWFSLLVVA